jgi:hypothetical protein
MNGKTEIPYNIEAFPKDEIVRLLKRIADERDEAILENNKGKKRQKVTSQQSQSQSQLAPPPPGGYATLGAVYGSSTSNSNSNSGSGSSNHHHHHASYTHQPAIPVTPAAAAAAAAVGAGEGSGSTNTINFDVAGTKKRILKNATQRIKKTVHTDRNKPYTEVLECVPTEAAVLLLMTGFEPKSHRHPMIKWQLNEEQVIDWLNMYDSPLIHPVTNKINTICLFGQKPNLYVHAKIESLEIKWERKSGSFNLRFRTMVAGYGTPPHYKPAK